MEADRFVALWNRCARFGAPEGPGIFHALERKYGEPRRVYHNGGHIRHCLAKFDSVHTGLAQTGDDIIELSIWFHDAVYEIPGDHNEAESARWFASLACDRLDTDIIDAVQRCILYTTHEDRPPDQCSRYVVDIDLSGLAQDWQEFAADGQKIREENSHLDHAAFVNGQVQFLSRLLDRERIFYTEYFNARLESRARQNIIRQLQIYR